MNIDINAFLAEALEELDLEAAVKSCIREQITKDVQDIIRTTVKTEVKALVQNEIRIALDKPVKTDDGWGKKEYYDSFEVFFKEIMKGELDSTWEMKRTITDVVRAKTREYLDNNIKELTKAVSDAVIQNVQQATKESVDKH